MCQEHESNPPPREASQSSEEQQLPTETNPGSPHLAALFNAFVVPVEAKLLHPLRLGFFPRKDFSGLPGLGWSGAEPSLPSASTANSAGTKNPNDPVRCGQLEMLPDRVGGGPWGSHRATLGARGRMLVLGRWGCRCRREEDAGIWEMGMLVLR